VLDALGGGRRRTSRVPNLESEARRRQPRTRGGTAEVKREQREQREEEPAGRSTRSKRRGEEERERRDEFAGGAFWKINT